MIDVEYEGGVYRYCEDKKKNYWIGVKRGGSIFPGVNCWVPIGFWPVLRKAAIEQGVPAESFIRKEKPKKKSVSRSKKQDKDCISIF